MYIYTHIYAYIYIHTHICINTFTQGKKEAKG